MTVAALALASPSVASQAGAVKPTVKPLYWVIVTLNGTKETRSPAIRGGGTYRPCADGVHAVHFNFTTHGVRSGTPASYEFQLDGAHLFGESFRWDLKPGPVNFFVAAQPAGKGYGFGKFSFTLRLGEKVVLKSRVFTSAGCERGVHSV